MADLPPEGEVIGKWIDGFDGQVIVSTTADGYLIYPRLKGGALDNQYMRHTCNQEEIGEKVLQVFDHMNPIEPGMEDGR